MSRFTKVKCSQCHTNINKYICYYCSDSCLKCCLCKKLISGAKNEEMNENEVAEERVKEKDFIEELHKNYIGVKHIGEKD